MIGRLLIALVAAILLTGCDPEPRREEVPHTFMVFRGYDYTVTQDDDGFSEYHYYLICEVGHHHDVRGWGVESWLDSFNDGDKLQAAYSWWGYLDREAVIRLAPDDMRNDEKLRAEKYAEWKKSHAAWERRQKINALNSGPGWFQQWLWPSLTLLTVIGCLCLLALCGFWLGYRLNKGRFKLEPRGL